jgi:TrmH family RNA methyltransferase
LREVFVTPEVRSSLAPDLGVPVFDVTEAVLKVMSEAVTPQGVVAVAEMRPASVFDVAGGDLVVVLAEVRDPGNAGTLIRSAEAAGAAGIVFTDGSVDPYAPKTVRAAAGSLFRLPIVRDVSLRDAVGALREAGHRILGADATSPSHIDEIELPGRLTFVLGNEAWGVPPDAAELLDETVGIRMPGPTESLNVAVAGSILLFEAIRRRS